MRLVNIADLNAALATQVTQNSAYFFLDNEMDMASLTFLLVNIIYYMLKRLCLKRYTEGTKPTACFLKPAFSGDLQ